MKRIQWNYPELHRVKSVPPVPSRRWRGRVGEIWGPQESCSQQTSCPVLAAESSRLRGVREDLRSGQNQVNAGGVGLVRFGECVRPVQGEPSSVQRREVDGYVVALREIGRAR